MRQAAALVVLLIGLALAGEAHERITSKFTYNADVYPVFLNRCGRCHIEGGVGPMSLLKYEEAFPWAESLRAELLTAASGDPHDFVKAAHRQISARELDVVLDWATGGTPQGDASHTPPETSLRIDWAAGPPDVIAAMPDAFHMDAAAQEASHDCTIDVPVPSAVVVEAFDVLPGNPAILRSAVLTLRSPDGTTRVLGTWMPRQVPSATGVKPPARLDPGARIVARMQYKKTWKYEGEPMQDLSRIGLYVAD